MLFVRKKSFLNCGLLVFLLAFCFGFRSTVFALTPLSIQIGPSFNGSDNTSTYVTPADGDGAIGPKHYVEFINGNFAVYSKTDGHRIVRITDMQFWSNAGPNSTNTGITFASSDLVSDPRVIFDPVSQRWFASQVDYDGGAADPTLESDYYLLAVSDSPDPTTSWHVFRFLSDPENGNFADFPTLGVDANAVYLSGDMYYGMDSNSLGSSLMMIPKADLLSGPPTIANRVFFGTFTNRGSVMQPATCVDGSSSGDILAAGDFFDSASIVATRVLNPGTAGATLASPSNIAVNVFTSPLDAIQPDGTETLAANDARFSARVHTVGGIIYGVHDIYVNGHDAIRWYRINATNYTLLESGTITNANMDLIYPSIAANTNGVVVIGCNGSGLTNSISSFAFAGLTTSNVTTFTGPIQLAAGSVSYHDLYEQIGYSAESRWGDYSATTVDPNNQNNFWTIQMLPLPDGETWVTRITELTVGPQLPSVSISLSGTNLNISWPAWATGFQLQSTPDLINGSLWTNITQTATVNGSNYTVSISKAGSKQFFRLVK